MELIDRYKGCLLGLAIGDAIGTSVEFMPRGTFDPVTDMTGGGFFNLPVGYWTDDTSMALCLGQSLIDCQGFDPKDQLRKYLKWYEKGYMSSTGKCFDIGDTTRLALERFKKYGNPHCGSTDKMSSGNGGLMRLAPVVLAYYDPTDTYVDVYEFARESSRTTHASRECLDCAHSLAEIISMALSGQMKSSTSIGNKTIDRIKGSGRASESLEAAWWCCLKTTNFNDAVLMAANLGDDADTTSAIVGQIAGALYGIEGIPKEWLDKLHQCDMIEDMAVKLFELNRKLMVHYEN